LHQTSRAQPHPCGGPGGYVRALVTAARIGPDKAGPALDLSSQQSRPLFPLPYSDRARRNSRLRHRLNHSIFTTRVEQPATVLMVGRIRTIICPDPSNHDPSERTTPRRGPGRAIAGTFRHGLRALPASPCFRRGPSRALPARPLPGHYRRGPSPGITGAAPPRTLPARAPPGFTGAAPPGRFQRGPPGHYRRGPTRALPARPLPGHYRRGPSPGNSWHGPLGAPRRRPSGTPSGEALRAAPCAGPGIRAPRISEGTWLVNEGCLAGCGNGE
jgi:hypothetical protein